MWRWVRTSKMTVLLASKMTASIVTASSWSLMTIVSSSLKADRTGCTWIMSTPGEVGPPISSPIPACLLQGQPSRRGGPPLAQGGRRFHTMIWRCRRCCPNESLVTLPGHPAKTKIKALILLVLSGWMYRSAFWGALTRISPFICPTQKCQISEDEFSSLSITSSQLRIYWLLPNVSSPSDIWENQINRHG